MKVTPEQLDAMRERIAPLDTDERRAAYRAGNFPRSAAVKDLDKRYRWDLLWESGVIYIVQDWLDSHIDTALRRLVPPL